MLYFIINLIKNNIIYNILVLNMGYVYFDVVNLEN